jgi:membrane-associated protease RseP (regulator of RpoE activity)
MFSGPPVVEREPAPVTKKVELPKERPIAEPGKHEIANIPVKPPLNVHPSEDTKPAKRVEEPPPPPDEVGAALVGLELVEATATELQDLKVPEGQTGVVVHAVEAGSPAASAALQKGDVIVRAQRDKISSRDTLKAAVGAREHTLLTVYRDGYPFQVVLHRPFQGEKAAER